MRAWQPSRTFGPSSYAISFGWIGERFSGPAHDLDAAGRARAAAAADASDRDARAPARRRGRSGPRRRARACPRSGRRSSGNASLRASRRRPARNASVVAVPPTSRVSRGPSLERREEGLLDARRAVVLADVAEHHHGREQERRRVRDALARDVGRRAVHGLEHGARRRRCSRPASTPRPPTRPEARSLTMSP